MRLLRVAIVSVACVLAVPAVGVLAGCKRTAAAQKSEPKPSNLVVKDDSQGLLLTWIDEKGDFHVEQAVKDVPLVGRDAVRVVDPTSEEGTHGDAIVVADLRTPRPDGAYPVRVMTRAEFDALAVARRQKHAPTLASAGPPANGEGPLAPPAAPDPSQPGAPAPDPSAVAARPSVIIYGASWCGACHQAAAYLRRKNITFVEKDIEADEKADSEMRAKLKKAGLRGGSIPVLDVRGVVMVGFSPEKVEEALGKAL